MSPALPWRFFALLVLTHWLWVRRLEFDRPHRLLAALLLASAEIVVSEIILGACGRLTAGALVSMNLAAVFPLLVFGLAGAAPAAPSEARFRPSGAALLLAALTAGAYGFLLWVKAVVPPYDWDSINYHLLDVLTFAKNGNLDAFPFPWIQTYFPKVGELVTLWLYLLGGADKPAFFFLNTVQVPYAFVGGLAIFSLAGTLGLERGRSLVIPLYVLTPLVMLQSLSAMVDVIGAAFFLSALAFIACYLRTRRLAALHLFALALGLALGTKFTFLYLSLPLLPLYVLGIDRTELPLGEEWRGLGWKLATLFGCFAIGGGFWMTRNLLERANPFYPVEVKVGPLTILRGPVTLGYSESHEQRFVAATPEWILYPVREAYYASPRLRLTRGFVAGYSLSSGFGPQFALALVCTSFALFRTARAEERLRFWTLMVVPLSVAAWLAFNPYREPRYILQICGVASLGLLRMLEDFAPFPRRLLEGGACAAAVFAVAASAGELAPFENELLTPPRTTGPAAVDKVLALEYGPVGEASSWIAGHVRDKTIVHSSARLATPLYGWDASNRLLYVPTTEKPHFPEFPKAATYRSWRNRVHELGADYVFFSYSPYEADYAYPLATWIGAHPEDFDTVRSWGKTAALLRPVYSVAELASFDAPLPRLDATIRSLPLHELDEPSAWYVEEREGTRVTLGAADDALRYAWRFGTPDNDYAVIVAGIESSDWSSARALEIEVFSSGAPDMLFVHLKGGDTRGSARFRIALASLQSGWNTVRVNLGAPEKRSPSFTLANVESIHLAVDDDPDGREGDGEIRLRAFRLTR